jgi:hypothetical protein
MHGKKIYAILYVIWHLDSIWNNLFIMCHKYFAFVEQQPKKTKKKKEYISIPQTHPHPNTI